MNLRVHVVVLSCPINCVTSLCVFLPTDWFLQQDFAQTKGRLKPVLLALSWASHCHAQQCHCKFADVVSCARRPKSCCSVYVTPARCASVHKNVYPLTAACLEQSHGVERLQRHSLVRAIGRERRFSFLATTKTDSNVVPIFLS